jgi:N-acetylmuramoyl-L-alanine amidase
MKTRQSTGVPFRFISKSLLLAIFCILLVSALGQTMDVPATSPHISNQDNSAIGNRQPTAARRSQPLNFSVVIDPAHGGSDFGARIAANVLEKDLSLTLARKLRQELQTRHIPAILLRDGDIDLSFEQRAVAANLDRPSVYISIHAEPGSNLRIYTPASAVVSAKIPERNGFLPWQTAQSAFQADSRALAAAMSDSISKRELASPVQPAFLEPLHSIAAPAIAVEVPANKKGFRISPDLIAGALADAIATRKLNAGAAQ